MFDTPRSANLSDFKQRYLNTYGIFTKGDGTRIIVLVTSVRGGSVSFEDAAGISYSAAVDRGVMFEFIQVQRGWFNTPKGALLLSRVPATQWNRGVSDRNTSAYRVAGGRLLQEAVSCELLSPLVNQTGIPKGPPGPHGVALSKSFAIDNRNIWLYNKLVGTVVGSKLFVNPLVFQELTDTVSRNKLEYSVHADNQ